jgi:UDP-N-acetylglucosamine 2-epimerase
MEDEAMHDPADDALSVVCVIGTRPEATKVAPLMRACRAHPRLDAQLVFTGQHPDLVAGALAPFDVVPDHHLDIDRVDGSLSEFAGAAVARLGALFRKLQPDVVVVQGDTATTLAGGLAGFWEGIPVVHLEAGLRSGDLAAPFPEEGNRRIVTQVASLHLAPTDEAAANLLAEGVDPDTVLVVGNTSIDAALMIAGSGNRVDPRRSRRVVITAHRRESWGEPLVHIAEAVRELAVRYPDHELVFPVHPNPKVRGAVVPILEDLPNVATIDPLDYEPFVALLASSRVIITDSGGIQEEAPALGVPVLVTREVTERPEGVAAGVARLVGSDRARIVHETSRLLDDDDAWRAMSEPANPYGDGRTSARSADLIARRFARRSR